MSPIERSNPRVMAGKAIFTDVSSCVAAVPSPIMATCHGFAWSRPTNKWGRSRLEIEVTLKSNWFNFAPAIIFRGTHRPNTEGLARSFCIVGVVYVDARIARGRGAPGMGPRDQAFRQVPRKSRCEFDVHRTRTSQNNRPQNAANFGLGTRERDKRR